jgi:uridine kinase
MDSKKLLISTDAFYKNNEKYNRDGNYKKTYYDLFS